MLPHIHKSDKQRVCDTCWKAHASTPSAQRPLSAQQAAALSDVTDRDAIQLLDTYIPPMTCSQHMLDDLPHVSALLDGCSFSEQITSHDIFLSMLHSQSLDDVHAVLVK